MLREDFQSRLEVIHRLRKTDLMRIYEEYLEEDSDGAPITTKRQRLSMEEAKTVLSKLLDEIRGERVLRLREGCTRLMQKLL